MILNFLRKKYWLYLLLSLISSGSNFLLIPSVISSPENNKEIITLEYLNKLPKNDYIIGPGDTLQIIVSREYPELTTEATIDGEGTIYLPRLNRIFVSGLNIFELNNVLNDAYKKFVKFPNVEINISIYRPIRVLVEGEVASPGLQLLPGSLSLNRKYNAASEILDLNQTSNNFVKSSFYFPTVFDAIRQSGGITRYSDLSNIQIIRNDNISNGGGKIQTVLNFEDVIVKGNSSQNIRIYDSDIIRISKAKKDNDFILNKAIFSNLNPKFINVFVTGRVNNQGSLKLSKASTLIDAISMAGNAKVLKGPTTFIRFNNDGSIDKRVFSLRKNAKRGSYKNPVLKDGDFISVGNNLLTSTSEIINEVTSPLVGIYSAYGLIKAFNDL